MKKAKSEYIPVFPGDRVFIRLSSHHENPEFEAVVREVRPRLGFINRGRTKQNPLIQVEKAGGEIDHLDAAWVVKVLERPKRPSALPFNIFKTFSRISSVRTRKGTAQGSLDILAEYFLRQATFHIPHAIDGEKLHRLFEKQRPGLVKKYGGCAVRVHIKPFRRWVLQNASRNLETTAELTKRKTQFNRNMEELYWESVEAEMDREFGFE